MPEEAKQNADKANEPDAQATPAKSGKGGLIKYILFGVAAMVIVLAATVAALYFMGDKSSATAEESQDQTEQSQAHEPAGKQSGSGEETGHATNEGETEMSAEDLGLSDEDQSAIDKIMDNLAFLEYEPSDDELIDEDEKKATEDSIKEVSWIESQKAALAEKEKELNTRQKDLDRQEKEVNKKLLNLEQVESARTAQLAKLYDGMDSRAVAKLLANLDDKTVVSILPRMKLKNASAVLQLMPSQRAAKLSKQMITIAEK